MKSAAHLVVLIVALSTSACMKDPHYPIANLSYIETAPSTMGFRAELRFSSDYDLDSVFSKTDNMPRTHEGLYCSFESPPVFEMQHQIPAYIVGLIEREPSNDSAHFYKAKLQFEEIDQNGAAQLIRKERVIFLAAGRPSIPCKVKINAWGYKAYYSNAFQLPIADFINLIPSDNAL